MALHALCGVRDTGTWFGRFRLSRKCTVAALAIAHWPTVHKTLAWADGHPFSSLIQPLRPCGSDPCKSGDAMQNWGRGADNGSGMNT